MYRVLKVTVKKMFVWCVWVEWLVLDEEYSKNPQIRTSTFKNLQSKIWGLQGMKIVYWAAFQCYSARTCWE